MTAILMLALAIQPGQPARRPRPAAPPPPASSPAAPDEREVSPPAATPPAYPDRASQNAAARRDARDRVVRSVGPEARDFMKRFGDRGIFGLQKCGPAAGKRLVALAASGGLDRLRYPLAALDAVRVHGDPAAEWLCDNVDRLQDPEALEAWARSPMEFVFDLRDVEQAAEELRASRRIVPRPVAAAAESNAGYVVAGLVLLAAGWAYFYRNRRGGALTARGGP